MNKNPALNPPRILKDITHTPKTKGFTLIELLVVIAIVGMLSILYFSWVATRANNALLTSAVAFKDNLQTAHIFSREAKDEISWGIKEIDQNTYKLVSGSQSSPTDISTFALDPQVNFMPPNFEIWFDLGTGETDKNYNIQLVNTNNKKVKIDISKSGLIEMSTVFN